MVAVWRLCPALSVIVVRRASAFGALQGRENYEAALDIPGILQKKLQSPSVFQSQRNEFCRTGKYTSASDLRWFLQDLMGCLVVDPGR